MGGVVLAREDAGIVQHGGGRTNRGDGFPRAELVLHQLTDARIGAQVFHTRATGEENQIPGLLERICERGLGQQKHSIAAGDGDSGMERRRDDAHSGAAQDIDGRDGLEFFETGHQDHEDGGSIGHGGYVIAATQKWRGKMKNLGRPRNGVSSARNARAMTQPTEDPRTRGVMNEAASPALLVLGAGYVGGEVVRQALRRGWHVAALTRNPEKAAALRATGCALVIEADLAGEAWHEAASRAGPFRCVLNSVSSSGGGIEGYRRSYLDGTQSIARWLATQARGGTIVYTSSTGVYPQGGGANVTEDSPTELTVGTGRVLLEAEELLRVSAERAGWRSFVLRLAGIYGPGRHGVLDQLRSGATALGGEPAHRMNLIHRDDAAAAVLACFDAMPAIASGTFNLADGAPETRQVFAHWIAGAIGCAPPTFDATAPVRPGAGSGSGRGPAPDRVIVADKIRRVLGWSPRYTDFRAGYAEIVRPRD